MSIRLNKQQEAAVTAPDGPALVLAGAGTGKTRVIVERLSWLVEERGIDPRHLLALTFTNRAAAEMGERFAQRLGVERVPSWLGTFHAFGLYVLRREMEQLGRPKQFTIFDTSDQSSLMKRLVRDLPAKYAKVTPRDALGWISRLKQEVQTPEDVAVITPEDEACAALWTQYHEALRRGNAVDFDDLLVLLVRLLADREGVREKYQRRYRYVLIDEYQDTNRAQYLIARHLSAAHGNLFVVGDEDQSIYSWRGADINNILDFAKDFESATVYRLEENYRSTQAILDAANAVVAHNVNRLGKTLRATQPGKDAVGIYIAEDGDAEARWVVQDMAKQGYAPSSVAVLYRTNSQSRLMEESLRTRGLHYQVVGGMQFYSRKEIKDILAYLRLLVNPDDDESVRRVINVPARGIGAKSLEALEVYGVERKQPLMRVMRDVEGDETFPARARQSMVAFVDLIDSVALSAKQSTLEETVERLVKETGYRKFVEESDEKDFRTRLEIVDEFIASCRDYDRKSGNDVLTFLQDMSLVSDADAWKGSEPAVSLMTCHSAKGLEFDHVYLIGMEEGLLPFGIDAEEKGLIEEERRLCYVAMTRARKRLVLTAAVNRTLYGRTDRNRELSRFIKEAGKDRLVSLNEKATKPVAKARPVGAALAAGGEDKIKTGTRVRHAKFGPGRVLYTTGTGDKLKAKIRFETGRMATLMVAQAPLEIL